MRELSIRVHVVCQESIALPYAELPVTSEIIYNHLQTVSLAGRYRLVYAGIIYLHETSQMMVRSTLILSQRFFYVNYILLVSFDILNQKLNVV